MNEQINWLWCGKCQELTYAGFGPGVCSAGGIGDRRSARLRAGGRKWSTAKIRSHFAPKSDIERGEPRPSLRPGRLNCGNLGVSDGTRTRDIQDHNLALYQLSYAHHRCQVTAERALPGRTSRGS